MRRAARTDAAHAAIRKALRKRGYIVADTHCLGNGYPDLHVSRDGLAVLVEVKSLDGELSPDELVFHRQWEGPLVIAFSVRDVLGWFEEHGDGKRAAR